MNLNPGEVWLADLGLAAKTRPIVIVSRSDPDPPRALAIYVPLTTQDRGSLYEVVLPRLRFLDRDSIAWRYLGESIADGGGLVGSVNNENFARYSSPLPCKWYKMYNLDRCQLLCEIVKVVVRNTIVWQK
jgi:hypothetical protein